MLRAINKIVNLDFDKTTHSDFDYSLYRKTSGVINFETQGNGFCNSKQSIFIANTHDMLPVLHHKMERLKEQQQHAMDIEDEEE